MSFKFIVYSMVSVVMNQSNALNSIGKIIEQTQQTLFSWDEYLSKHSIDIGFFVPISILLSEYALI